MVKKFVPPLAARNDVTEFKTSVQAAEQVTTYPNNVHSVLYHIYTFPF